MTNTKDLTIIDQVREFIETFVFIEQRQLYFLLAVWVISTYLHKDFEYVGYIFAYSPEKQSGKSRLLEVLDVLVHESSGILVKPTPAILFRAAEGKSQLFDEVDAWTNTGELRSILNAGFRRGAKVARMDGDGNGGYACKEFPVFAPRALAGIGAGILDDTTRDRTFSIEMVPQKPDERREKFSVKRLRTEIETLKEKIGAWVEANRATVAKLYEDAAFPYLDDFRDRTIDISQPLAAIVEIVYQGGPDLNKSRDILGEAIAITREGEEAPTSDFPILNEVLRLAISNDPLIGTASELAAQCSGLLEIPSEYLISATLQKYNFKTRSIRNGGKPRYRYSLPRARLQDLVDRYGMMPNDQDMCSECSGSERGDTADSPGLASSTSGAEALQALQRREE